jgi:serine/threonine-protein kinase RsbW
VPGDGRRPEGHHLTAPAEPASLEDVHALLAGVWSEHDDVTARDRMLFEIAVTEVAGNIVEHAADGAALRFTLDVRVRPDRVEAEFRDRGRRLDVDPTAAALPSGLEESGRGLAMALAAVDALEYRRDGPTNCWRVVRRRRPA